MDRGGKGSVVRLSEVPGHQELVWKKIFIVERFAREKSPYKLEPESTGEEM